MDGAVASLGEAIFLLCVEGRKLLAGVVGPGKVASGRGVLDVDVLIPERPGGRAVNG